MILCLVTDRRRADPVDQAARASAAGVDLIQIRERDLDGAALAVLVDAVLRAVAGRATRVIVNDRLDVALACGAHGVHLRADSIPPAPARRLAPAGFLIGRSVHAASEAREAADSVDYLIAGTTFATPSKADGHPRLGIDGLRAIVGAARVPVLAIGGVTRDRLAAVAATGATGIAAIGLFAGATITPAAVSGWRTLFDGARPA